MLTVEQQFVLELLRSALGVQCGAIALPEGINAGVVVEFVREGGILLTVFPELKILSEAYHALQDEHAIGVAQNYRQMFEGGDGARGVGTLWHALHGIQGLGDARSLS